MLDSHFLVGALVGLAGYWAFQHFTGKGSTGKAAKPKRGL